MKYILAFLFLSTGFATQAVYADPVQQTHQLLLYYSPRCPHCKKVISYLDQNGIEIPMKDVTGNREAQDELKIYGYLIVPCLVVDGKPIYDANKIIDWLSTHQEYLSKSSD